MTALRINSKNVSFLYKGERYTIDRKLFNYARGAFKVRQRYKDISVVEGYTTFIEYVVCLHTSFLANTRIPNQLVEQEPMTYYWSKFNESIINEAKKLGLHYV